MDEQQKQLVLKLKDAQNVLVTVSKNPSVDQLAAAIGLTLALNKLDKHATAVYSGQTPSTIEFLKPEETLETNTDSLRDFIIALDKSKADKLRYKVEDQLVRIFITPYKTSISENDLEFSQGDFNVDVVVALGVKEQSDLDQAITAHGRILHDAVVSTISLEGQSELGTLNVVNTNASSLSEIVTKLVQELDKGVMDNQIATALLTGIVAMTDRFSNDRTSPETMSISALLMSAGANQQLIASELEAGAAPAEPLRSAEAAVAEQPPQKDPGMLEIDHESHEPAAELPPVMPAGSGTLADDESDEMTVEVPAAPAEPSPPQVHVDENGQLITEGDQGFPKIQNVHSQTAGLTEDTAQQSVTRERVLEPPALGGELTANTNEEGLDGSADESTEPTSQTPILSHNERVLSPSHDAAPLDDTPERVSPPPSPVTQTAPVSLPEPSVAQSFPPSYAQPLTPPSSMPSPSLPPAPSFDKPAQPASVVTSDDAQQDEFIDTAVQTLSDIERVVDSPHVDANGALAADATGVDDVDAARRAVDAALAAASSQANPDPIVALNAQPLGPDLRQPEQPQPAVQYQPAPGFNVAPVNTGFSEPTPGNTPADSTLDMPLPGTVVPQQPLPSSFPGVAPSRGQTTLPPPPPLPPPPIFPTA